MAVKEEQERFQAVMLVPQMADGGAEAHAAPASFTPS